MEPMFCTDITTDKGNEKINGEEFITKTAPKEARAALDEKARSMDEAVSAGELPGTLKVAKLISGGVGAICGTLTLINFIDKGISETFKSLTVPAILGILGVLVFGVLYVIERLKAKSGPAKEKINADMAQIKQGVEDIMRDMNVPENAPTVDIIMFRYTFKDGKMVPKCEIPPATFYIFTKKIYLSQGWLCFADADSVYSIERSTLTRIKTVKKKINILGWNKEKGPGSDKYKDFKLTSTLMGAVSMDRYYTLEFEENGKTYGVYFPSYELPTFELYSGLKAESTEE